MDLKSLIAKMDALSEAEVDPQRAAYDKFKADNAKAAAQEQVKKLASIPLDRIPRLGDAIDPKTGILYYGEAGMDASTGTAKKYPFKWLQRSETTEAGQLAKLLKTAGLEIVPVVEKTLFGTAEYAGVNPEQLATLSQAVSGTSGSDSSRTKTDNSAEMAKIKQLEELVDKYLALKKTATPTKESTIKIADQLIESFGYQLDEADTVAGQAWDAVKAGGTAVKNGAIAAGKKLAVPVGVAFAVWEVWTRLSKLPPNMTAEQTKIEVTREISKVVATFGTFWVGAILGGIMAGAVTGPLAVPAAIAGAIGGGLGAEWLLNDKAEVIVDKVVDYLMKDNTTAVAAAQPKKATTQQAGMPAGGDPDIVQFQQGLKNDGYDLGTFGPNKDGIDGKLGPKTVTAIQQDLVKQGAKVAVNGQLDQSTLGALIKVYGIEI